MGCGFVCGFVLLGCGRERLHAVVDIFFKVHIVSRQHSRYPWHSIAQARLCQSREEVFTFFTHIARGLHPVAIVHGLNSHRTLNFRQSTLDSRGHSLEHMTHDFSQELFLFLLKFEIQKVANFDRFVQQLFLRTAKLHPQLLSRMSQGIQTMHRSVNVFSLRFGQTWNIGPKHFRSQGFELIFFRSLVCFLPTFENQ